MAFARKLTSRQRKFVEVYAFMGNGARAARLAGYSHRTARQVAHENLTKPYILEEIEKIKPDVQARISSFIDDLYAAWKIDIADIVYHNGELKPLRDWPVELRTSGAIKCVVKTEKSFRIELHNRFSYPELIAKILTANKLRWPE